jgi:CheY-like chemotaxis protein
LKTGPIILVEDDVDDQEFIVETLHAIGVKNEILIFDNGQKAFEFLKSTDLQPFLILSDLNLPIMNGMQLKAQIEQDEALKSKCVPFIFLTTSSDSKSVKEAFELSAQGFFVKENTYDGIHSQLKQITEYWKNCRHPNMVVK